MGTGVYTPTLSDKSWGGTRSRLGVTMNSMRYAVVAVLVGIVGCADELNVLDGSGRASVTQMPIINGTTVQDTAVVGLHQLTTRRGGSIYIKPFCTGTLIDGDVVLTAAHCLDKSGDGAPTTPMKPSELAISIGSDPAGDADGDGRPNLLDNLYMVSALNIHPSYNKFAISDDIGLVRLNMSVTNATPYRPLPAALALSDEDLGADLRLVGFGQSDAADSTSYGVQLEGYVPLSALLSATQMEHTFDTANPDTSSQICFGDSGGPAFLNRGTETFVVGVASYVTSPYCEDTGVHTRVDAYGAFISTYVVTCGDNICSGTEDCSQCSADCGTCPNCAELNCDDFDPCTDDSCNSVTGCAHAPNDACAPPTCSVLGTSCVSGSECCSAKCGGPRGAKTCR